MSYGGGVGSCLMGAQFNMSATLLHQNDDYSPVEGDIDLSLYGEWVRSQDPITKEIVRVWKPFEDMPSTPDIDESIVFGKIPCVARGIINGGITANGNSENFGATYDNIDYVHMWTPTHIKISKSDRVTNISDPDGKIIWVDEEYVDPRDTVIPRATVFNVNGVTPLLDSFNRHTKNFVMLERAEVYGAQG